MDTHHNISVIPRKSYDRSAKKDEVLKTLNQIRLPILRALIKAKDTVSAYRRHETNVVRYEHSGDYRMHYLEIDLPATREVVVYGFYISAQEWYIRPSDAARRANRFKQWFWKRVPPYSRTYVCIIGKRFTSRATRILEASGLPPRKPQDIKKDMIKFFRDRVNGLKAALAGKRVYGELALLAWILTMIYLSLLGHDLDGCMVASTYVLSVAEKEFHGLGPPTGEEFFQKIMDWCENRFSLDYVYG